MAPCPSWSLGLPSMNWCKKENEWWLVLKLVYEGIAKRKKERKKKENWRSK
jgi:hypothetical protein